MSRLGSITRRGWMKLAAAFAGLVGGASNACSTNGSSSGYSAGAYGCAYVPVSSYGASTYKYRCGYGYGDLPGAYGFSPRSEEDPPKLDGLSGWRASRGPRDRHDV